MNRNRTEGLNGYQQKKRMLSPPAGGGVVAVLGVGVAIGGRRGFLPARGDS
jgi:hypothetical protein